MVKSAERWVKKQIDRVSVAEPEFRAGVEAVVENPAALALKANAKRIAKIQESIAKKTWESKMAKIGMEDWRAPTLAKAARFTDGVEKAKDKISAFVGKFRGDLEAIQSAVKALPDVTDADREKRMLENLRRLKKLKGKY